MKHLCAVVDLDTPVHMELPRVYESLCRPIPNILQWFIGGRRIDCSNTTLTLRDLGVGANSTIEERVFLGKGGARGEICGSG